MKTERFDVRRYANAGDALQHAHRAIVALTVAIQVKSEPDEDANFGNVTDYENIVGDLVDVYRSIAGIEDDEPVKVPPADNSEEYLRFD